MLEARGLTKRYGGLLAVDRVDFCVRRGEVLGYLGPNGSGKSTTVNMVVGLLQPGAGDIFLDGRSQSADPVAYRSRVGYVPEEPYLYTHLTAQEYLTLVGRLRDIPAAALEQKSAELLRLFLLHDARYSTMAAFSKGMRQRVLLAAALMHNPDLLVLDEPFSGLDVNAALLFQSLIGMFAASGRMVLFSTHRFDMVEKLCSRAVILSKGKLVAEHVVDARLKPSRSGMNMERDASAERKMEREASAERESLEQTFVRVTGQKDFAPVAREILAVMQHA